jgi:hypothetical protein
MDRPICSACNQRFCAVNCYREDKVYYRSRCTTCISKNRKIKPARARWELAGYKKKSTCDLCGFRSRYAAQLLVYHVDGNLANSNLRNLKTICQNCTVAVKREDLIWRAGDLEPDL